jgi:hypothetical protein
MDGHTMEVCDGEQDDVALSATAIAVLPATAASGRGGGSGGGGGGFHAESARSGGVHGNAVRAAGAHGKHGGIWRGRGWGFAAAGVVTVPAAPVVISVTPVTYNGYGYDDGYPSGSRGEACEATRRQVWTASSWRLQRVRICAE